MEQQDNVRETHCGLGPWRPRMLQRLASKKVYMLIYGLLGIVQGMFYTYLSAMISTLEKEFGIKSKESAILMSGNEISQILFAFAMPFMVKVKRRPLWVAVGLALSGLGSILMCLPHFTRDSGTLRPDDVVVAAAASKVEVDLCRPSWLSASGSTLSPGGSDPRCDDQGNRVVDWAGLALIFGGILLTGVGNCLFYSFGVAYLDDNTSHENSPTMLGLTYTFRLLGPTFGFLLGSFCLRTYVDLGQVPPFEEGDPRWVGAWWLGFPIIGVLTLTLAAPLALFPRRLPKGPRTDANRDGGGGGGGELLGQPADVRRPELPRAEDDNDSDGFGAALKRLLANKLFVFNLVSSLFYVFAFMGFGTFMPKYIEFQFRKKGSTSSALAGGVATLSKALGLLASGFLISRFRPSARLLSGWNVVLGALYFVCLIAFSFLGCPTSQVYGVPSASAEGSEVAAVDMRAPCNAQCACPPISRPQPVCSKDGVTNFYSPCMAGCLEALERVPGEGLPDRSVGKAMQYRNCSCVEDAWARAGGNLSLSDEWVEKDHLVSGWRYRSQDAVRMAREKLKDRPVSEAVEGWCPAGGGCDDVYMTFLALTFGLMVLASTGRIGSVLVALRCVEVRDKSLSLAFNIVLMSLLAMLPAPIVYGAIIDSTCILWQESCGGQGGSNCVLYDTVRLRTNLMLTTAFIMLFGVVADIGVWYEAKHLVVFSPPAGGGGGRPLAKGTAKPDRGSNLSLALVAKDSLFLNGTAAAVAAVDAALTTEDEQSDTRVAA